VKIKEIQGVDGSDYINASWLRAFDGKPRGYISTQGPIDSTIGDFWRMIWEHNVNVMVMLTKIIENGEGKCASYWDDSSPAIFGSFKITLNWINTDISKDFVVREFQVENLQVPKSNPKHLIHFHFTGWPDYGLPPSTLSFINLLDLVDNQVTKLGGPIGIHCSAGIGRSGTFCTVHINIRLLREHYKNSFEPPPLNIVNTVLALRRQRPGMVQTKEQFIFCYRAILDEYVRLWKSAKQRKKRVKQSKSEINSLRTTQKNTTPFYEKRGE